MILYFFNYINIRLINKIYTILYIIIFLSITVMLRNQYFVNILKIFNISFT